MVKNKVSTIITAFKEPNLYKCLNSILNQELPKNYEISVVAPDKETLDIAKKYQKKNKRIKILKDPGKGKPTALNLAFQKIKSDILVLTDGDVILAKNSIKHLLKHFKNPKVGAVSAKVIYQIPKNSLFYEWAKLSEKRMHEIRLKESKKGIFWHPTGYLYAIRNGIVKKIPSNSLSDDAVIGYLIKSKGYQIVYEPKAKVYVKFPTKLLDFIRQKSRTRAGFYQIRKWFKFKTRTLESEMFNWENIKTMIKIYGVKNFWKMILIGSFYFLAWLRSYWLIWRKKPFKKIWKRIESTK